MAKFSLNLLSAIVDENKNVKTVFVEMKINRYDGGETNWGFALNANKETDITDIMSEVINDNLENLDD